MVFKLEDEANDRATTYVPWVYVNDIQEHFRRAEAGGATIQQKLDAPWGLPMYIAEDIEGNQWTFAFR